MPEVRHIESGKLLCLEAHGALRGAGEVFSQIDEYVQQKRIPVKGDRLVVIYAEPLAIDRNQAHYAAAVELAGECTGDGELTVVVQSSMTVVSETHQGPQENLAATYQRLVSWITEKGYVISGPPREFLLAVSPSDPGSEMTEVQIPVRKSVTGEMSGA